REMSSGRSDGGRRSLSEPQSSLQSGGLDRSHNLLLEYEEDRQGRQSSDGRSGQNIIPVSRVLLLERLDAQLDHSQVRLRRDRHRPDEGVPVGQEEEYRERRQDWA